ncbi:hypothetical protein L6R29_03800 [Myxococcota bacterium]|nr:hypothetical protein [Myxococcota bacterium]
MQRMIRQLWLACVSFLFLLFPALFAPLGSSPTPALSAALMPSTAYAAPRARRTKKKTCPKKDRVCKRVRRCKRVYSCFQNGKLSNCSQKQVCEITRDCPSCRPYTLCKIIETCERRRLCLWRTECPKIRVCHCP